MLAELSLRPLGEINALNAEAHFNRGSVSEQRSRLEEIAEAYVKALRLNPGNWEAMQHLERLIGMLRDDTQAVIWYLSALRRGNG